MCLTLVVQEKMAARSSKPLEGAPNGEESFTNWIVPEMLDKNTCMEINPFTDLVPDSNEGLTHRPPSGSFSVRKTVPDGGDGVDISSGRSWLSSANGTSDGT